MRKLASLVSAVALLGVGTTLAEGCSTAAPHSAFDQGDDGGPDSSLSGTGGPGFTDAATDAFELLDSGCATGGAGTSKDPVYLEIVLDCSGSMDGDKWTAATGALQAVFDDMLTQGDTKIGVGLELFCSSFGTTPAEYDKSTTAKVYPGYMDQAQHTALSSKLTASPPGTSTPTYAGIIGGYHVLQAFQPQAPLEQNGKKVLVLVTDGVPDGDTAEQQQCITEATTELGLTDPLGPIKTFAVGVGPFPGSAGSYDPKFMSNLAIAGGTRSSPQCDPNSSNVANVCHFQITPGGQSAAQLKQEFINALNKIRGIAAGCEFTLDTTGDVDPKKVNVIFTDGNGKDHVVPQDANNGWTYDDPNHPTKVILHGQSCGDVTADLNGNVRVILGCASITK